MVAEVAQHWDFEKACLAYHEAMKMSELECRQDDDEDCVMCSIASESPLPSDINLLAKVAQPMFVESEEDVEMDVRLWSALPEELMIPILARLPLRSFIRFRSVCKQWHSLTYDARFRGMYAGDDSQAPLCIMHDEVEKGYAYDPISHTWHRLHPSFFSLSFASSGFSLLAATGGLVLLEKTEQDRRNLFVANPLNRSERHLPSMLESQSTASVLFAGMVINRETGAYNILIVEEDVDENAEEFSRAEIYSSKSNTWKTTGRLPTHLSSYYYEIVSTVLHNGELYCLICFSGRKFYAIYRINLQDLKSDQHEYWQQLDISLPQDILKFGYLFENRGQLMFGAEFENDLDTRIHIWQVDLVNGTLEEVLRLPKYLKNLTLGPICHFLASGDYLWMSDCSEEQVKDSAKVCEHGMVLHNAIMCNLVDETWWTVPRNPISSSSQSAWCTLGCATDPQTRCLFLFEPRIDVVA